MGAKSPNAMDLDAYFQRIGYEGPRAPSLEVLTELHLRHAQSIAFENLEVLLKRPVRLDLESLERKLVREGRGGYCFEQNHLFKRVLEELGFAVIGLGARTLWNVPEDAPPRPRTHMLLLVRLDGTSYIVDVGFGGLTLTAPLRLEAHGEQSTPHERFRFLPDGRGFFMQAKVGQAWKALYRFDLEEQLPADYELANWFVSTHPSSHFVNGLIAARPERDRRHALLNNEYTIYHRDGRIDRRSLTSALVMRTTLEEAFGLTLPAHPELDGIFERLTTAGIATA